MECPPPFALVPADESVSAPAAASSTPAKLPHGAGSEISLALARTYWLTVVSAHSLTALFYYGYAAVYAHLNASASSTDAVVQTTRATTLETFNTPVAVVSHAIAIGHVIAVVNALLSSWRSRELVFSPDIWLDGPDKRAALAIAQPRNRDRWCILRVLFAAYYKLKKRGLYIAQVCTAVEVALQIFQTNKLARFVASRAINRTMVAAVVLDCWHLPLVHFAFRKRRTQSPALEVLAQHVVDASLTIVYGLAVPAAIFFPHYYAFDASGDAFLAQLYYRDTWSAVVASDSEQIFVTSWIDFIAKMAPGLALLYALWQMQTLLQVLPRSVASQQRHICLKLPHVRSATTAVTAPAPDTAEPPTSAPELKRVPPRGRIRHALDAMLLFAGIAVLALHAHADVVASRAQHIDTTCLLAQRPWGTEMRKCAVLEVNCAKRAIAGDSDAISAALASVDARAVRTLIVSHCPALAMPSRIQRLSMLATLKLHNVTLAHWGDDAALTAAAHPHLARIYVSLTNMSALPRGLVARDFPPRVRDIALCATNLTTLPTDLVESWRSIAITTNGGHTFALEQSRGIVAVPESLAQLQLRRLSLAGNSIRSVTAASLSDPALLRELLLSGNPLESLPNDLSAFAQLTSVDITDTDVLELPASWRSLSLDVRAVGTPLCVALVQDAAALDRSAIAVGSLRVDCVVRGATLYPLADEVQWRAAAAAIAD